VVLVTILVVALVHSANVATSSPTPVPSPGATSGTGPAIMPQPDIGVLDQTTGSAQPAAAAPKPGQPAPDFAWYTTNGRTTLSAMRGHAVLLEFFGAWCPSCQSHVQLLDTLQATYHARGLQVLAVTGSPYGINYETSVSEATISMADLLQYQQTYHVTYQTVLDPTTRVFNMYGRGATFPTFYVIDAKGVVRWGTSLAVSDQALQAQVAAAL
jgi:peroxiredoxin